MASNFARARKISRRLEKLGMSVEESVAGTGTIYLTVDAPESYESIKIRVADHGDCYCTADISCDPDGHTEAQVVAFADRWLAGQCRNNEDTAEAIADHEQRASEMRRLKATISRLAKQHLAEVGDWILMANGDRWIPLSLLTRPIFARTEPHELEQDITRLRDSLAVVACGASK